MNITISKDFRATYLKFHVLFHPHVCTFIKRLNSQGVAGLLSPVSQALANDPAGATVFNDIYDPTPIVHHDHPKENTDFRPEGEGAYSLYNWELFFHAVLLIADRLSKEQRFALAQKWYHYLFDPTAATPGDDPRRFWKFLPFHENDESGRIEDLLETLNHGSYAEKKQLEQLVADWRDDPFKPHLIARGRMIAYQKRVVHGYIQNLIDWADQLFARDTIETINEATLLYVLAYRLLGRRPAQIPSRLKPKDKTYSELKDHLDAFSNAMIELESAFPFATIEDVGSNGQDAGAEGLGTATAFYFCIPPNDKLLSLWDIVEDRLFKIRHCMNIEGIIRQLPLFEPPIDPALLVKAAAAGLDLGSVLADIHAPLPCYRFQVLLQKAVDFCAEVKSLGQALLSVVEKKDAEGLSALRVGHETVALEAARETRRQNVHEAGRQLEALKKARKVTEVRHDFYENILDRIPEESNQLAELGDAQHLEQQGQGEESTANEIAAYAPDITVGFSGMGGHSTISLGRANVIAQYQARSREKSFDASQHTHKANMASITGSWVRRTNDWKLQLDLATKELEQIDKQIGAAEIRVAVAENDLHTHDTQIENSKSVEEFLRNKYTSEELYGWMLSQVSTVYFQSYKLAYEMARKAERAFRFERGLIDSSFIQFGYWDGLKKGLVSGEKLLFDLKRMEAAFLTDNRREHEITKHVSLNELDPFALLALKQGGYCEFEIPEALIDLDYPGHYMRRIKSVSVTLPCVVGPYTGIHCTLTLLRNRVRVKPSPADPYVEDAENPDPRFITDFVSLQSIATSNGQNDPGLFELNFGDTRYLPFEGAGLDSRWRIEMPKACNAFDFNTLSDVILTIRYTARDGGTLLREKALAAAQLPEVALTPPGVTTALTAPSQASLVRMFSARYDFPNEWHRFLHPADTAQEHKIVLDINPERFPFAFRDKALELLELHLFVRLKEGLIDEFDDSTGPPFDLSHLDATGTPDAQFTDLTFASGPPLPGLTHCEAFDGNAPQPIGRWNLLFREAEMNAQSIMIKAVTINGVPRLRLDADVLDDLLVLCRYSAS
jgi:Tc toxin complex TcA C-terminal TcB-binding domain